MVRNTKKTQFLKSSTISASEISQFCYCSNAWYLQKCGYKPKSPFLEIGKKKHIKYGDLIDHVRSESKKSSILEISGYILFIMIVFIIIFKVIL